MSTPNTRHTAPTHNQVHAHLLEIDPTLRAYSKQPVALPQERIALDQINNTLKRINTDFAIQARALYQGLDQADLTQAAGQLLLERLKTSLNKNLQSLDETSVVAGQSRKTYLTSTAGISALELETLLNVNDYLLSPADQKMLEDCSRGPTFRPGMYALTFGYQDQTVAFAAAFVLTRQASPIVDNLDISQSVGPVLLFTPSRGLEAFDSLHDLDLGLKAAMAHPSSRAEFSRHLPVAYQHLDPVGIWPLGLQPIEGQPLFEHLYQALLDKRDHDITHALNLAQSAQIDAAHLKQHLDSAIEAALPDLSLRLDFRTQRLLERDLHQALPDWYRSSTRPERATLTQHLRSYNSARQAFINLFGPAATPQALARHQWAEYLADELDIHDLDPDQLHITTRRTVPMVGSYDQRRSLVDLALRGLHPGDSSAGSDFLKNSTLTYAGAPLDKDHADLTPHTLATLMQGLQPRLDFANVQKMAQGSSHINQAARTFFDLRLLAMAYLAKLQGHLNAADFQLIEHLREQPRPQLCAQTVMLHGAQLSDLWLLREDTADGQVKRLLLCTPDAPKNQQFFAFNTLRECQAHIIGWVDDKTRRQGRTMRDYLLEQVILRFRPKMRDVLQGISLRPDAEDHLKVTFGKPCSHTDCLDAMATHRMTAQADDYEQGTPAWYRAASPADRERLAKLGDDAEGALRIYNARPDAEAQFTRFEAYLHDHAKRALNSVLGRSQNDVDPDTVFIYPPKSLASTQPKPVSYTYLYRDGYEDGVGFINEKFSASATFSGPAGVDLSALTALKVARSVTGVWIGQRYTDEVRQRLQGSKSSGYDERRNAVLAIQQLQMKSTALESRLRGHIASVDLAWLEKAIDSLSAVDNPTRNLYKIHRLCIDGDWVIGNYLFSHGANPSVLYTPDAPDGVHFREAKLFNYLLKKVEGMQEYWGARVPLPSMTRVAKFLKNASNGLPGDINRTTPSPARHDSISHITPLTDLRHEFYNMSLQRKIDNVHATTVNRTQMITGILWTCIEWVTAVATMPFPILSLTLGGLLAFKDAMLALNAYHQNDRNGALEHFIGYLANIGGALLFDARPLLKRASKAARPAIKTSAQATPNTLISQVDTITPENMQPVLFNGQSLWAPQTPDAIGRYLLYRQDPLTGQLHSTSRLVNQNAEGQWVRSGIAGGGRKKPYERLVADESSPMDSFNVQGDDATNVRALLDPEFKDRLPGAELGFEDIALVNAINDLAPLREAYRQKVAQLTQSADAFFLAPPTLAPKAPLPALATNASHSDILKSLFGRDKRLIIGADNHCVASKQLLIEQLPSLVDQGLKRVYIENLPRDVFHRKLNILNGQLGDKSHALRKIEAHLRRVDEALGFAADAPFTYRKLLLKTQELKIKIDGLDAAASYHMEHVLALGDGPRFIPRASKLRNFYSHTTLKHIAGENPDEGWIALVESNRLGSYERVTGLADLHSAPALRVEDAAPGQPIGIRPDTIANAQSRGDYALSMSTMRVQTPTSATVAPQPVAVSHFAEFDMPTALHPHIEEMRKTRYGLDTHYTSSRPDHVNALHQFSEIRQRLASAAQTAFSDFTPAPRAALTHLSTQSEQVFIEQLYRHKLGLVIGESHIQTSAKQLLIDNMKVLKKQGVKTLYMEHVLTDLHQEALDTYHRTSKMPTSLKNYLTSLDWGHMPRYKGTHTFTNVVKTANKYGLRIRALDCTASYHVKGIVGDMGRGELFSYFANEVIKADQLAEGAHKWVAFMGNSHTDMYRGVPGIVQLQDAVSLHVQDTFPHLAKKLRSSSGWRSVGEHQIVALRSDFKIDVGSLTQQVPQRAPLPDRTRLTEAGHFFIEYPSEFEVNLVHRSRANEIVTTPIQIDDKGQYFIERWDGLKDSRFFDLSSLTMVLKAPPPRGLGLRQIT